MKSKEELSALKEEVEALSRKLAELSEDELKQVAGGANEQYNDIFDHSKIDNETIYEHHFYPNSEEQEFKPNFP